MFLHGLHFLMTVASLAWDIAGQICFNIFHWTNQVALRASMFPPRIRSLSKVILACIPNGR